MVNHVKGTTRKTLTLIVLGLAVFGLLGATTAIVPTAQAHNRYPGQPPCKVHVDPNDHWPGDRGPFGHLCLY